MHHVQTHEMCRSVPAFHDGENMLVINPLDCGDCGCCVAECPIDAIVYDTDPLAEPWLKLNAQYSRLWPNVSADRGQTPPDADQFGAVTGKFDRFFSPEPGKGDVGSTARHL